MQPHPQPYALYEVSVRQARCLPPASFRFHLATDTLAIGYVIPAIRVHSGLAPFRHCSCRAYIISIQSLFWTRIGWFFEDVWHWLKRRRFIRGFFDSRYSSIVPGPCFGKEDLTDEEIHEIMNIIHHGNPPKYKIKREEK